MEVFTIVKCRCQSIRLGHYELFNIYAPSGSAKRHERNLFFGQDIFDALSQAHSSVILSGDFNLVLSPLDLENGTGYNQKHCNTTL